jgi:hypothetical protein
LSWATGGGGGSIDVANTAYVDSVNGNDGTGAVGRYDLPYLTISAAIAAAVSGQAVIVRPGTYAESGINIGAGIRLLSEAGWAVTSITGALATGTRVTLSGNGASIEGFKITVPIDNAYAIENTMGAGSVGSIFFCTFVGQAGSIGYGIGQTGLGKTISFELRFSSSQAAAFIRVVQGVMATQGNHIPGGTTLGAVWLVEGGRFQGLDLNCGSPGATDALQQSAGVVRIFTTNWFNVTNAIHFTGNSVDCSIQNGEFDTITLAVLVDPLLTLTGAIIRITANHQPLYSFPPAALGADFAVSTFQRGSTTLDPSYDIFGVPLTVGFPELGQEVRLGQGGPYNSGQIIFRADSATPSIGTSNDGLNFVDITTDASSKSGSSFGFTSGIIGDVIYLGSARKDNTGTPLKHFGSRLRQITRSIPVNTSVTTDFTTADTTIDVGSTTGFPTSGNLSINKDQISYTGTTATSFTGVTGINVDHYVGERVLINSKNYTFEIWDGVNWVAIKTLSTSVDEGFVYSDQLFNRDASLEDIRYGVDDSTTWVVSTVNGVSSYWSRVVITQAPETVPVFEQLKLHPSSSLVSAKGVISSIGLGQFRTQLGAGGNIFGESGGVTAGAEQIGTGATPTGWTHNAPNSLLNSSGDAIYATFTIPDGINTAFPITLKVNYVYDATQDTDWATCTVSIYPAESTSIKIADFAGGKTPINRQFNETSRLSSHVAQTVGPINLEPEGFGVFAPSPSVASMQLSNSFEGFDISEYYPGDNLYVRVAMPAASGTTDIYISSIAVEGVKWTRGATI